MSQSHAAFPAKSGYGGKLPDRTGTGPGAGPSTFATNAQPFGQSAPIFPGRGGEQTQTGYSYAASAQQAQQQQVGFRPTLQKDSNILNDLSDEQKEEINEAFRLFDNDKDRHLDYHELRVSLRALGFTISKPEALTLMQTHGVPKAHASRLPTNPPLLGRAGATYHPSQLLLPHGSFTRIAAQKMFERDPRDEVERAFHLFDTDQKGYITLEDLRRVTHELGETSLDDGELQGMIEEFDYEERGGISKDAFFGICMQ